MIEHSISDECTYSVYTIDEIKDQYLIGSGLSADLYDKVKAAEYDDIIEFEYDPTVKKKDKLVYELAAGAGLLTSLLDVLITSTKKVEDIYSKGEDIISEAVIKTAAKEGLESENGKPILLKNAIKFIEDKYHWDSDSVFTKFGGGTQHHFKDFTHHKSLLGLIASIICQTTGKVYGLDKQGNLKFETIEKSTDPSTGIIKGTFVWLMHLTSDMDGSSNHAGSGTGIPGPILSLLTGLSSMPFIYEQTVNIEGESIPFSDFLLRMFEGKYFINNSGYISRTGGENCVKFDLRMEQGLKSIHDLPVLLNDCITRAIYMIATIREEFKDKGLKDITHVNWKRILPIDHRSLTHMLSISSVTFTAVNATYASIAAAAKSGGDPLLFCTHVLLRINFQGVKMCIVCGVREARYVISDKVKDSKNKKQLEIEHQNFTFSILSLNRIRILYSLMLDKTFNDAMQTHNRRLSDSKFKWIESWKTHVSEEMQISQDEIFMSPETAYSALVFEISESADLNWFFFFVAELFSFIPYYVFAREAAPTKLVFTRNVYINKFCEHQNILSGHDIKNLISEISDYDGRLGTRSDIATFVRNVFGKSSIGLELANDAMLSLTNSGTVFTPHSYSEKQFITRSEHVRKECAKIIAVCKMIINHDNTQVEYVRRFKNNFDEWVKDLGIYLSYNIFNPNDPLDKLIRKDYEAMLRYLKNTAICLSELI